MKLKMKAFLASMILPFLLAGCGDNAGGDEAINLAVIIGNRANSLTLGQDEINIASDLIRQAFEIDGNTAQGHIAFVISDGNPQQIPVVDRLGRPTNLAVDARNPNLRDRDLDDLINNTVIPFLDSTHTKAQAEEADLVQAIQVANNILRNMPQDRNSHLLIIDSGISTSGIIDLTAMNIQDEDFQVSQFVNELNENNLLPDLNGSDVTFIDLGGAAGAQGTSGIQQVPQDAMDTLGELWQEVIMASNGNLQDIRTVGNTVGREPLNWHEGEDSLPFVSSVNFNAPTPTLFYTEEVISDEELDVLSNEEYEELMKDLTFGAELGFIPYEDILRSPSNATNILKDAAAFLSHYFAGDADRHAYVVGSEADSRTPRRDTLSEERATRVIEILVNEFGLPANRLHAVGGGTTVLPWRNANERPNGVWNEYYAQQNRLVTIVPSFSDRVAVLEEAGLID